MSLSETISSAEGRISEAVENGRLRLRAVVDSAEEGVEATLPRLRDALNVARERSFEDAERLGGYVTEALTWVGGHLPTVSFPLTQKLPTAEEVATSYFETAGRVLDTQRKLVFDWIGAIKADGITDMDRPTKAKPVRAKKEAAAA